jgi:hypothetical protein
MADIGLWGSFLRDILPLLTTFAATIAAVLAWCAKLRWSKEFAAAKNAEIATLKTQVDNLKAVHTELVKTKDAEISTMKTQEENLKTNHTELVKTKDAQIAILNTQVDSLKKNYDDMVKEKDAHAVVLETEISLPDTGAK